MNHHWLHVAYIAGCALLLSACTKDPMAQVRAEAEQVKARDWSHLAGLPEPETVLARISHPDPMVAVLRQCQVLTKLHELLADDPLFAPRELGSMPNDGLKLRDGYQALIDQELFQRFRQLHRGGGDPGQDWRQACEGKASRWREQSIDDNDWLALLVPPARDVAERQLEVYAKGSRVAARTSETKQQERVAARKQERLFVMAIGIMVTLLGIVMMRKGWRIQRALAKYEFEHRNPAGVVEFASYEDSVRHRRRKYIANQILFLGGALVMILGVIVFLARMGE